MKSKLQEHFHGKIEFVKHLQSREPELMLPLASLCEMVEITSQFEVDETIVSDESFKPTGTRQLDCEIFLHFMLLQVVTQRANLLVLENVRHGKH